ncbi:MAG: cupin domain-containing protein [Actinomycetota bacterium]
MPALGEVDVQLVARGSSADGDFVFQRVVVAPGGKTSWHKHPGPQMVVVVAGSITRESRRWPPTEAGPGDAFLEEPGDIHAGFNKGNIPVEMWTLTVVPSGADPAETTE